MRASELIGSPLFDENGRFVGVVRDLRLNADRAVDGSFSIEGIVYSDQGARQAAAYAWGFAEGRAQAPSWLKRMLAPAIEHSCIIPADRVLDWGPERVKLRGPGPATSRH